MDQSDVAKDDVAKDDDLDKNFASNTTCHGLKQVADSKRSPQVRTVWAVIVLTAFCFLFYQSLEIILQYKQYQPVSSLNIKVEESLDFPALTVCNYNRFMMSSLLNISGQYDIDSDVLWNYLALSTDPLLSVRKGEEFTDAHEKIASNAISHEDLPLNITKLITQLGNSVSDMLILEMSSWTGSPSVTELTPAHFRTSVTKYGLCHTFNDAYYRTSTDGIVYKQVSSGPGSALTLFIDIKSDEYSEQLGIGHIEEGILVYIHSPYEPVFDTSTSFSLEPGVYANLVLQSVRETYLGPPYGMCDAEKTLDYFANYSDSACTAECGMRHYMETCGCLPITLYYTDDATVCNATQLMDCPVQLQGIGCNKRCGSTCEKISYQGTMSFAAMPNKNIGKQLLSKMATNRPYVNMQYLKENYIFLDVYYQELTQMHFEQKRSQTFEGLLADIGGQMGLFVGASIITVTEVVEYLGRKCNRFFCKGKRPIISKDTKPV